MIHMIRLIQLLAVNYWCGSSTFIVNFENFQYDIWLAAETVEIFLR